VNDVGDALLVYGLAKGGINHTALRPWQFHNQFPSEFSFFEWENRRRYLDRTNSSGTVCRPMLYNGGEFSVNVYWLVLSIDDPLIVMYHDGYLDIPYAEEDEYEFLLPIHSSDAIKNNVATDGSHRKSRPIWRGSWSSLDYLITADHPPRASIRRKIKDPAQHVKSQIKRSLVKAARGFESHHKEYHLMAGQKNGSVNNVGHGFALYVAEFEISRSLDTFFTDLRNLLVRGEEFQEAVDLHDDLYGKAIQLLEGLMMNSTTSGTPQGGNVNGTTQHSLTLSDSAVVGGWELLIYDSSSGDKSESFSFDYDWTGKAMECFD
jgi:hypothetical protein